MAKAKGEAKRAAAKRAAGKTARKVVRKAAARRVAKKAPRKAAKKVVRKASATRWPSAKQKQAPAAVSRGAPSSRAPAPAAAKRDTPSSPAPALAAKQALAPRAAFQATALTSAAPQAAGADAGVQALQNKLDALGRLLDAFNAQLGKSPADDVRINDGIDSLTNSQRVLQAQIAAAQEGTLDPPSQADVSALQAAIKAADDVIARNASVDQLIGAAAALIKTLQKMT